MRLKFRENFSLMNRVVMDIFKPIIMTIYATYIKNYQTTFSQNEKSMILKLSFQFKFNEIKMNNESVEMGNSNISQRNRNLRNRKFHLY